MAPCRCCFWTRQLPPGEAGAGKEVKLPYLHQKSLFLHVDFFFFFLTFLPLETAWSLESATCSPHVKSLPN